MEILKLLGIFMICFYVFIIVGLVLSVIFEVMYKDNK